MGTLWQIEELPPSSCLSLPKTLDDHDTMVLYKKVQEGFDKHRDCGLLASESNKEPHFTNQAQTGDWRSLHGPYVGSIVLNMLKVAYCINRSEWDTVKYCDAPISPLNIAGQRGEVRRKLIRARNEKWWLVETKGQRKQRDGLVVEGWDTVHLGSDPTWKKWIVNFLDLKRHSCCVI